MCTLSAFRRLKINSNVNPLQSSSRSRKSFKLKERVMLVHAWVTDTGSLMAQSKVPERGFILGTPLKTYHFLAPTMEEKNMWFQELQSRIFTQKRLFNEVSELHSGYIGYSSMSAELTE